MGLCAHICRRSRFSDSAGISGDGGVDPAGSTDERIVQQATKVLKDNDLGTMVMAAPRRSPHQWSWDAAFIAIGLACISVPRAITEMRTLLRAQWDTG
jgi:hypothetical protein